MGCDRGHILLGLLIIMVFVIAMLLSIQSLVGRYLFQERKLGEVFGGVDQSVERLLAAIGGEGEFKESVVSINSACRLFGREDLYLDKFEGIYKRRLPIECLRGETRELLGFYVVGEHSSGQSYGRYTYVFNDLPESVFPRLVEGEIAYFNEYLQITIFESGKKHLYDFFENDKVENLYLLQSATPEGFYLLSGSGLWLLPREERSPKSLKGGVFLDPFNEEVVTDLVTPEGVYLLKQISSLKGCEKVIMIEFYPRLAERVFGNGQELFRKVLRYNDYKIVFMDDFKVVLELKYLDTKQLLSVAWDGQEVWGERYLWDNYENVNCPLQSEPYEPFVGWVLGCQRKDSAAKIGFQ